MTEQLRDGHRRTVFVAGDRGLVGQAVMRQLAHSSRWTALTRTRAELDLTQQSQVLRFFETHQPDAVVLAAARVGGIHANNTLRWDFIRDNLLIATNVIDAARQSSVSRLVNLGSTCIYPRMAEQPLRESSLLTGPLEFTNEPYAIAKIAALKMCEAAVAQFGDSFVTLMPTNLYGPGDNFHPEHSHVLPALMRRFHEAHLRQDPSVVIWGTGTPRREFLHVDDLARAILIALDLPSLVGHYNVGTGKDLSIMELARQIAAVVGYVGAIETDSSKPDGTPRKVTDPTAFMTATGWAPQIDLSDGIAGTYAWWCQTNTAALRL